MTKKRTILRTMGYHHTENIDTKGETGHVVSKGGGNQCPKSSLTKHCLRMAENFGRAEK